MATELERLGLLRSKEIRGTPGETNEGQLMDEEIIPIQISKGPPHRPDSLNVHTAPRSP